MNKKFNNTFSRANPNISVTVNTNNLTKNVTQENNKDFLNEKIELDNLINLYNLKRFDELASYGEIFVEKYPKNVEGLNALALGYKNLRELKRSISLFKKAIEIDSSKDYLYQNLGNLYFDIGNNKSTIDCQNKAIKLNPKNIKAINCLGLALSNSGDDLSAINYYQMAISLNPTDSETNYNIATSYRKLSKYKEASFHYSKSSNKKSKSFQLECMYLGEEIDKDMFYSLLTELSEKEKLFPLVACISKHASIKFSKPDPYPFCRKPFEFIRKFNLYTHKDFNDDLIKQFLKDVNASNISKRGQSLLKNGVQTSGNLFLLEHRSVRKMLRVIEDQLLEYRSFYSNFDEKIIKNWPKKYNIFGWLIEIKRGGSLSSHMHNEGWLSSSIYLSIPDKINNDDGNIKFSLDGANFPKLKNPHEKPTIIDINKGDMVSFPSSLFHSTIPFQSQKSRVTLAFDVIPAD